MEHSDGPFLCTNPYIFCSKSVIFGQLCNLIVLVLLRHGGGRWSHKCNWQRGGATECACCLFSIQCRVLALCLRKFRRTTIAKSFGHFEAWEGGPSTRLLVISRLRKGGPSTRFLEFRCSGRRSKHTTVISRLRKRV